MFADYIRLARPDHWIKNIFVLPGFVISVAINHRLSATAGLQLLLCMLGVCLISSANYVLNEWLDARLDRFHPTKKYRPAALGKIRTEFVIFEYLLIAGLGLAVAWFIAKPYFWTAGLLLLMGILYNVKPMRTKDIPYLDVLSESINNPLRFLLGWFCIGATNLPPSSLLLGYWMGGAYLMALKRFAELRTIGDRQVAIAYRRSFHWYTEETILVSAVTYSLCAAFFLGVLLVKYRVELVLAFPLLSVFFGWYLLIALKPDSAAQHPEKLYREIPFMVFTVFLSAFLCLFLFIRIPILEGLLLNPFSK